MEKWYQKSNTFQQQQQRLNSLSNQLNEELQEQLGLFEQEGYTIDNWENMLDNELRLIDKEQRKLSEQQTHLQVQAKFSHFASELKPGSPCPLCGALEHPEPMLSHQVKDDLQHLEQEWNQLEQQRAGFQTVKSKLTRASITIQTRRASFDQLQADLQNLSEEMN